jgi:hypothetical protein
MPRTPQPHYIQPLERSTIACSYREGVDVVKDVVQPLQRLGQRHCGQRAGLVLGRKAPLQDGGQRLLGLVWVGWIGMGKSCMAGRAWRADHHATGVGGARRATGSGSTGRAAGSLHPRDCPVCQIKAGDTCLLAAEVNLAAELGGQEALAGGVQLAGCTAQGPRMAGWAAASILLANALGCKGWQQLRSTTLLSTATLEYTTARHEAHKAQHEAQHSVTHCMQHSTAHRSAASVSPAGCSSR